MNRDELLQALLTERFSRPTRKAITHTLTVADIRHANNDDDLTTYARRKALDDACDGFGIPRSTVFREPTPVDDTPAGQRAITP